MNKPPQIVFDLLSLGTIRGIVINYHQTGTDTAETYCEILGNGTKNVSGMWRMYSPFLDVQVDWASVARVKGNYRKDYEEWVKFEKANAEDLATYNRLKVKFEGGAE